MPKILIAAYFVIAMALSACAPEAAESLAGDGLPTVTVFKNETCGCCNLWVEHLRKAGFTVNANNVDNLGPIKEQVGVPIGQGSCHTAQVGDYFVEGHVPADDIKRLLRERPHAKGLAVPAMPMGSPGMESPSGEVQPYDVLLVAKDGATSVYAHHGD
jgi:hypothetical protein